MPKNLPNKLKISCFCDKPNPKIFIKGKKFDIVKCRNCKLIYANTNISKKDIISMYDQPNSALRLIDSEIEKDDCVRRLNVIKMLIKKSARNKKLRVLDFGTGMSNFMYIAKKKGLDVYGYDLDPNIIAFHKKNNMKMVDINHIKDGYFDVITLFHVLEHIDTPLDLLKILKKKLRKGGIIYIDVPNGESLEIKLFGEKSPYVDTSKKAHLYYYSLKTLSKILEREGFKVVRRRHKGVFAIGLIAGFKNKITGSSDVQSTYSKGRWIANIYRKTCELLRISDCIEVIAKK